MIALLRRGLTRVRTAHVVAAATADGVTVRNVGDEELAAGSVTALELTESAKSFGELRLIIVGGKTYAIPPPSWHVPGKPWALITEQTTNQFVVALAQSIPSLEAALSPSSFPIFVAAATSVTSDGTAKIGSILARRYSVLSNVKRLPQTFPPRGDLYLDVSQLPIELWLDPQGALMMAQETYTVNAQSVTKTLTLTNVGERLSISAPPASQVASG